jgi:hypothetical protein
MGDKIVKNDIVMGDFIANRNKKQPFFGNPKK